MKKRAIDLTFDELAEAGREAAQAAIARTHAMGLPTTSANEKGQLIRTYPDGRVETLPETISKKVSSGRRKTAA